MPSEIFYLGKNSDVQIFAHYLQSSAESTTEVVVVASPFTAGAEELNPITYTMQHKNTEHLEKKKKEKSNVSEAEDKLSDVRECVGGV